MQDIINFKGHFKIQAVDANDNVVDEWEDNNMIMESARTTMSEIFANLSSGTPGTPFINGFKLGTLGHVGASIITPKGKDEGFVKERTRLFSAYVSYAAGNTIPVLRKGDCIKYTTNNTYYIYIGEDTTNYLLSTNNLGDTALWDVYGTTAPYVYNMSFVLPGVNGAGDGTAVSTITEDVNGAGSMVYVKQEGTSVTFTINVANPAANAQNETTSIFTEAALYANSRIFAMKTFKAKVKDSTVLLRIIWTITF